MSVISQFFPSGESSGGGGAGSSGYIDAKILVVGGGAGGYSRKYVIPGPPSCGYQNQCGCCWVSGQSGGIIYADGVLKPGATCPITVGDGSTSTTVVACTWSCAFPVKSYTVCYQDGQSGDASNFGGTGALCAGGGTMNVNPFPPPCGAPPTAICVSSSTGAKNIGLNGNNFIDKFQSGYGPGGLGAYEGRNGCIAVTGGNAGCCNVLDINFECFPAPIPPAAPCTQSHKYKGLYHELLGTGQVVGGGRFNFYFYRANGGCIICGACPGLICPTYTDAIKNWTGAGNGSGSGGEMLAGVGGCPGSVIIQYPIDSGATPAPNRPGSVDCSPNTPGFYTYYYLTPGSITLP